MRYLQVVYKYNKMLSPKLPSIKKAKNKQDVKENLEIKTQVILIFWKF